MRRDELIHEEYVGKIDDDGCGRQEKERKTEAEVDGQCECGLAREKGLSGEETHNRNGRMLLVRNIDPT